MLGCTSFYVITLDELPITPYNTYKSFNIMTCRLIAGTIFLFYTTKLLYIISDVLILFCSYGFKEASNQELWRLGCCFTQRGTSLFTYN